MTEAMQEASPPAITGLESGRLPIASDVLALLDSYPKGDGVALDEIVVWLLGEANGMTLTPEPGETHSHYKDRVAAARVSQRLAFRLRVEEIAEQLISDRKAEWVRTTTGARVIRLAIDLDTIGDMAVAAGEDPEAAMAKADPSYVARYREGCTFWRRDGFGGADPSVITWAMVGYPVNAQREQSGGYWLNVNRVPVVDKHCPAMGKFYTLDGATEYALDSDAHRWWREIDKVPERIARRLEQGGWVPWHKDAPPTWHTDMWLALRRELATLRKEFERGMSEGHAWWDDMHDVVSSDRSANVWATRPNHGPTVPALASDPAVYVRNEQAKVLMDGSTPSDAYNLGIAFVEMIGAHVATELARNGTDGLRFFFTDEAGSTNTCAGALTLDTYKQAVAWMRGHGITPDTVLIDVATDGAASQGLALLAAIDGYNADVSEADRLPIPRVIPAPLNNPGTCYVVSTTGPSKPLFLQMRNPPYLEPKDSPPHLPTPFAARWRFAVLPGDSRTIYRIQATAKEN